MVELPCVLKLCSLTCAVLAAGSKAFDFEHASRIFEAGGRTLEVALAFREGRRREVVSSAVRGLCRRVEHDYGSWLASEFRNDPTGLADAQAAILSLDFVLPRCLPDARSVIAARYDAVTIAKLVVETAARNDQQFGNGTVGARLLYCLVWRAFEALQEDETFCQVTEVPFRRQVLEKLSEIGDAQKSMPDIIAEKVVATLEARGKTRRAEAAGLDRPTIIELARRLKPELLDFDQALIELNHAVDVALNVIARGASSTDHGEFVNAVLVRVAEQTKARDFDGGARAIHDALAAVDSREAELNRSLAELNRSRVALLEAGIDQDTLRRNSAAVARWVATLVAIGHPTERPEWLPEFRHRYNVFYAEGEKSGVNFSLSVAIELARRMVATAQGGSERSIAASLLGRALRQLGKRETGTERLEQALIAFREAIEEQKRELIPLQWAATQDRIGRTLLRLGEREAGTEQLEQAVKVLRESLEERKREIVPLQWAQTQNNLGAALLMLGGREAGTERLYQAVTAFKNALEEFKEGLMPRQWATAKRNLSVAYASIAAERNPIADVLIAGLFGHSTHSTQTEELEQAAIAHREVLEKQMRELVPLDWAATQNNIGAVLSALGEQESGTERLEQAVTAYRNALEEYKREHTPFNWAHTQINLANALQLLGARKKDAGLLEQAVMAYDGALAVLGSTSNEYYTSICRANRDRAHARIAELR